MDYGDGAVRRRCTGAGARLLRGARSEMWTQRLLKGTPRYYDRFGAALAAGDFNGDGDDELAVGVPGEKGVQVLAGARKGGLTKDGDLLIKGKGLRLRRVPGGAARARRALPAAHQGASAVRAGGGGAGPGQGAVRARLAPRRARIPGLLPGKVRELSSGPGLYGYAFG